MPNEKPEQLKLETDPEKQFDHNGTEIYNVELIFEALVQPKVKEIFDICEEHNIPFIAAFAVENTALGANVCAANVSGHPDRLVPAIGALTAMVRDPQTMGKMAGVYALLRGLSNIGDRNPTADAEDSSPITPPTPSTTQ